MDQRVVIVELSVAVASARRYWRTRINDVRQWALAQGRPVDPDLIALVLAARDEWSWDERDDRWTRYGVYVCLWGHMSNWTSVHRVLRAAHEPEALWMYLHYLRDRRLFDPGSDPFRELLKPLRCYGGLDARGRPHDRRTELPFPCVCKVPYRSRADDRAVIASRRGEPLLRSVEDRVSDRRGRGASRGRRRNPREG